MPIVSQLFLLAFLPLGLLVYWLLPNARLKLAWLAALSVLFAYRAFPIHTALLLGLALATYFLARRGWYGVGVLVNLGVLGYFKYWNFGAAYLNRFSSLVGGPSLLPILQVALPLGLSYYVFKHISYLLDVRAARHPASNDLLAFVTYSALFFQISAGPLSRYADTGEQLVNLPRRLEAQDAYEGMAHIAYGLAKKLLLADPLFVIIQNWQTQEYAYSGLVPAWLYVFTLGIHIYLDFSAYTDIVLGAARLFGLKLPPNFNNPYLATSPSDYWERWHISLSSWFRLYVFSPLSRWLLTRWDSARREWAQYISNLVTMTLVGLWHGAGLGYVLWGAYNGVLLNVGAWLSRRGRQFPRLLLVIAVFTGYAFFFSAGRQAIASLFGAMAGLHGLGSGPGLFYEESLTLWAAAVLAFSGAAEAANLPALSRRRTAVILGAVLALGLLLMGAKPGDFAYVRF